MAVTLRDLLKQEWFSGTISLLSDMSGLDCFVTWPYIRQTAEIAPWVNGGELVFVYHLASTTEEQLTLLKEGIHAKVSAFVFLCGDGFIPSVTEETLAYANTNHIAVFSMPCHIKLIDVTRAIAELILQSENKERLSLNFLNDILDPDYEKDEDVLRKEGYECGIDMDKEYLALSLYTTFDYSAGDYGKIMSFRNTFSYVLKHIEHLAVSYNASFLWKSHVVSAVCFLVFDDSSQASFLCEEIDTFLKSQFLYREFSALLGYSNLHSGVSEAKTAASESEKALTYCRKSDGRTSSCHYQDLGVLRLLVNSNSKEELQEYCEQIFQCLIHSDKENHTEYLLTVKTYLENNNNMSTTAKKLFIHRNTLISRISKIEELTGKDLNNANVKLEFLCGFKILEFLMES